MSGNESERSGDHDGGTPVHGGPPTNDCGGSAVSEQVVPDGGTTVTEPNEMATDDDAEPAITDESAEPTAADGDADPTATDDEEFDPIGTMALILVYFSILVLSWVYIYFVEFLGRDLIVLG